MTTHDTLARVRTLAADEASLAAWIGIVEVWRQHPDIHNLLKPYLVEHLQDWPMLHTPAPIEADDLPFGAGNARSAVPTGDWVLLPGGTYTAGSPPDEEGRYSDEEQVEFTVKPFAICRYPVTQEQWTEVMGGNPSRFQDGEDASRRPVETVSWYDAVTFCNRLSERDGLRPVYGGDPLGSEIDYGADGYRLPTEAEWEYACRAGTTGARYGELDEIAWHWGNSGGTPHPVGQKAPNAWGLYDMLGNVWEWCEDPYHAQRTGGLARPGAPFAPAFACCAGAPGAAAPAGCGRAAAAGTPPSDTTPTPASLDSASAVEGEQRRPFDQARGVSFEAVAGAATPATAGRATATGAPPQVAPRASASALPVEGEQRRPLRGGSWYNSARHPRAGSRFGSTAAWRTAFGFRLCRGG